MSKHIRRITVLALCLAMMLISSAALAAAPKLKLTVPGKETRGGADYVITVNATEPGFLTMMLTQDGSPIATLTENKEIHTKDNEMTFKAYDDNGAIIKPGSYTVSAVMIDQFGVSSETVSKEIKFKEPKEGTVDATPTPAPKKETAKEETKETETKETETKETKETKETTDTKTTAKATATPKAASTVVTYTKGSAFMSNEGYEIGVGVSDAAASADGYWALTSESTDEQIWAAMQKKMVAVNVGEDEKAYIYDSIEDGRKRLGTVSGTSQGLNVVAEVGVWSLVEAFRVEDGAFVRGYIRSNKLRSVEPNPTYGLLIDKAAQTLTVYKEGVRIGSTPVSTGLPTVKYLHRETPAGEFITVTRRGTIEYYGNGFSKYTIRINGSYHLSEIPTTKKAGTDYSMLEGSLGTKTTRGNIVIAQAASTDGGINAEWIWNLTNENKRVKVLILDDKDRCEVPVGE